MSDPPDRVIRNQRAPSQHPQEDRREHEVDLEDLLQRRVSPRRRVLQGLGLAILVVLVSVLIGRSALGGARHPTALTPTPTPIPPGPVLILSNVSSGVLTVNGRQFTAPPPVTATLRRGTNTFVLASPPLLPLTCQATWPEVVTQGQCDVIRGESAYTGPDGHPQSYVAVVELWFNGDNLSPATLVQTRDNITTALQALPLATAVPASEYVATGKDAHGGIISERVAGGGHADLLASATNFGFNGDRFCEGAPGCTTGRATATEWIVTVGTSVQWRYTPASAANPSRISPAFDAWSLRAVLSADPQAKWQLDQQQTEQLNGFSISLAMQDLLCRAGLNYLDSVRPSDQFSTSIIAFHGLEGCVLQLTTQAGAYAGLFIWRFGVLLAADTQGHALLPTLPNAPASAFSAVGLQAPPGT